MNLIVLQSYCLGTKSQGRASNFCDSGGAFEDQVLTCLVNEV